MLEVCLRLNIKCVSAYAFSIENFKRPEEEVSALMKLAEEKLAELVENGYVTLTSSSTMRSTFPTAICWTNMVFD